MQPKYSGGFCLANFIVISTIPILFFASMVLGYLGIVPLNVPIHSLAVIGFILFIFLLFISHNANYSICKIRSSSKKIKQQLEIALDASALIIEGKNKSVLDIDAFLKRYYADVRNDNFVSVASSIFPMLGILGTFIAIALSMPDFSVKDTQALDHEISMLLNGVGSAFFASIYGILLSLIWTYFEKRGLSKIDNYFISLKNSFVESIWSQEELTIYKYTQYDLKENRFIAALKETFSLDFLKEINKEHLYNFTQVSLHVERLSGDLRATLKEMDTSTSAIHAKNHIDKALIDFTLATKSFEKNTKIFSAQLNNSLNRTFDKIDTEIGEIVIKLADFATHVSIESREVQDSIAKYHNMVANHVKIK